MEDATSRTNWDTAVDFLGHTTDTHKMTLDVTSERIKAVRTTKETDWPRDTQFASVQEVLSIAGTLWNLTCIMRAVKYFVWHLLRLTGLRDKASRQMRQKRQVRLGWESHSDFRLLEAGTRTQARGKCFERLFL